MDNREIDTLIAERVFNWEWREREYNPRIFGDSPPKYHVWWDKEIDNVPPLCLTEKTNYNTDYTPPFSLYIEIAWEIVEKLAKDWPEISISKSQWTQTAGHYECVIEKTEDDRAIVEAETPAMAICLAALAAVGVEVE